MKGTDFSVSKGNNSVVLNSYGAYITSLSLNGVTVLTTVTRGDSKQAATHPCTPNFGPETATSYGLPQHGPMRTSEVVMNAGNDVITAAYSIQAGTYPKGMEITQTAKLDEKSFTLETVHFNSSNIPLPLNFGEHCYWDAPDGWDGIMVNGIDITAAVSANDVIELREENLIEIPGKPRVILRQSGLPLAMCWAYGNHNDGFDAAYVCIEPIQGNPKRDFFGSEASLLAPSASIHCTFTISVI